MRADAQKPFIGMKVFAGEFPCAKDISVAKNYLSEDELKILNNLVSGYFDLAEISALEHRPMYMADYVAQLDAILSSGGRTIHWLDVAVGRLVRATLRRMTPRRHTVVPATTVMPVRMPARSATRPTRRGVRMPPTVPMRAMREQPRSLPFTLWLAKSKALG